MQLLPSEMLADQRLRMMMWWAIVRTNFLKLTQVVQNLTSQYLGWLSKLWHLPMRASGFTLAELLIVLAVLGIIATFSIPKVLTSVKLQKRYNIAQDVVATIAQLNNAYLQENNNCFVGDMTCSVNSSNGAALDGGKTSEDVNSYASSVSIKNLVAYADTHLNYTQRYVDYRGRPLYLLPNGTTISLWMIVVTRYDPTHYGVSAQWESFLDLPPVPSSNYQEAYPGVDGQYIWSGAFSNGVFIRGGNDWSAKTGQAYSASSANIFDSKDHPNDTCASLGGQYCGQ